MTANALSQPLSLTILALTGVGWVIVSAMLRMSHSRSALDRVAVPEQQVHRGGDGLTLGAVPHRLFLVGQQHQLPPPGCAVRLRRPRFASSRDRSCPASMSCTLVSES